MGFWPRPQPRSLSLPGYPSEAAADVVLGALREWLEQHKDKVRRPRCWIQGAVTLLSALPGQLVLVPHPRHGTGGPGRGYKAHREKQDLGATGGLSRPCPQVERLVICVFLEKDETIYLQKLPHYFPVGRCLSPWPPQTPRPRPPLTVLCLPA